MSRGSRLARVLMVVLLMRRIGVLGTRIDRRSTQLRARGRLFDTLFVRFVALGMDIVYCCILGRSCGLEGE